MVVIQSYLSKGIQWLEERLVELSYLFLIIGFCLGTVDLFTQGTLMSNGAMTYLWAITQAVAIDGSFFVKWKRLAVALYFKKWGVALAYLPICLLLSLVAWAVNDIQSMAEVLRLSPIESVQRLGLDLPTLTHIRGALVVLVAISIAVENAISKAAQDQKDQVNSSKLGPGLAHAKVQASVQELGPMELAGTKEVQALDQEATSLVQGGKDQGPSEKDQGPRMVQDAVDQGPRDQDTVDQGTKARRLPMTTEGLKVYDAYTSLLAKGTKPTASLIQVETGVSLNTAKKYLREIRLKEAV